MRTFTSEILKIWIIYPNLSVEVSDHKGCKSKFQYVDSVKSLIDISQTKILILKCFYLFKIGINSRLQKTWPFFLLQGLIYFQSNIGFCDRQVHVQTGHSITVSIRVTSGGTTWTLARPWLTLVASSDAARQRVAKAGQKFSYLFSFQLCLEYLVAL